MSLDCLFEPDSIAVYGASASDPNKLGNKLLANAACGAAEVVAIHPSAAAVGDIAAVPHLDRRVDLALISVPAKAVESAVTDAASGARVAIVLSSGFGETGDTGRALQDRLARIAAGAGMRLVGPNCMGVVSYLGDDRWLNGSYFWAVPRTAGGLAFVSQSGAFGGMFFAHLRAGNTGLSRFLSIGNSADVSATDALQWLGNDSRTTAIGMFIEGIEDGRRFVEVARGITVHKPVVVLKAGKMKSGARAAASHTGSMAGSHLAFRAGMRRAGVVEADDTESFFDALDAAMIPAPRPRKIAIVTISGGPSVLAADAAERAGLSLAALGESTLHTLRALTPPFAALGNPVDLTPQCPAGSFIPAMEAVFADPGVEGVVVINCGLDFAQFGTGVARGVAASGKPATAYILDAPAVAAEITAAGLTCFASPERAVNALAGGRFR